MFGITITVRAILYALTTIILMIIRSCIGIVGALRSTKRDTNIKTLVTKKVQEVSRAHCSSQPRVTVGVPQQLAQKKEPIADSAWTASLLDFFKKTYNVRKFVFEGGILKPFFYSISKKEVHSEITPLFTDEVRTAFNLDELLDIPPFFVRTTISGTESGTTSFCNIKKDENFQNQHEHTSILKHYLKSLIAAEDLNTIGLGGQNWLSHTGTKGSYFVCSLQNDVINQSIFKIAQLGVPALFVIEDYYEGAHFDSEYAYVCHNGHVVGRSKGGFNWTDTTITKQMSMESGNIGDDYCYETVFRFGPQRLVYCHKGHVEEEKLRISNIPIMAHPREPIVVITKHEPKVCLDSEIIEVDENTDIDLNVEVELYKNQLFWNVINYCESIIAVIVTFCLFDDYLGLLQLIPSTIVMYIRWRRGIDDTNHTWLYYFISVLSSSPYIGWVFDICELVVVLCDRPFIYFDVSYEDVHLYGPRAQAFKDYLNGTQRDQFGLPFGFYHIDANNIVRLPPAHHLANWSNLIKPVENFNIACAHAASQVPVKFNDLFRFNWIDFSKTAKALGVLCPNVETTIKQALTTVSYKLNITEPRERAYLVHLTDYPELSQYGAAILDHKAAAASVCTRLLQRTLDQMPVDVYLKMFENFWRNRVMGTDPTPREEDSPTDAWFKYLDQEFGFEDQLGLYPDFSHYNKRKRERMQNGYDKDKYGPFYNTFFKNESLPLANVDKKGIRIITPNSPAFNAHNLNFFHAFEKKLLNTLVDGVRLFAKGLNYDQRFDIIKHHREKYQFCFCCDFSNFDGHHRNNSYFAEMLMYGKLGLPEKTVTQLMHAPKQGAIEHALPSRCSGDLFTGSGNCLVIASMFDAFGGDHAILCDGDDTLFFTNREQDGVELIRYMERLGFSLRIDKVLGPGDDGVEFCQIVYDVKKELYHVDINRRLSKAFNFNARSQTQLEKIICGKVQSLVALSQVGVKFKGPIPDLAGMEALNEDNFYKMVAMKGCKRFDPDYKYEFDLTNPLAGWISKIITEINREVGCQKEKETTNKMPLLPPKEEDLTQLGHQKEVRLRKAVHKVVTEQMEVTESIEESYGLPAQVQKLVQRDLKKELSLHGSTTYHVCTKTLKYINCGSLGNRIIQQSLQESHVCPTILIQMNKEVQIQESCHNNKDQDQKRSTRVDKWKSQSKPGMVNHSENNAEDQDHSLSNSYGTSVQKLKEPLTSGSIMMSLSEFPKQLEQNQPEPSQSAQMEMKESSSTPKWNNQQSQMKATSDSNSKKESNGFSPASGPKEIKETKKSSESSTTSSMNPQEPTKQQPLDMTPKQPCTKLTPEPDNLKESNQCMLARPAGHQQDPMDMSKQQEKEPCTTQPSSYKMLSMDSMEMKDTLMSTQKYLEMFSLHLPVSKVKLLELGGWILLEYEDEEINRYRVYFGDFPTDTRDELEQLIEDIKDKPLGRYEAIRVESNEVKVTPGGEDSGEGKIRNTGLEDNANPVKAAGGPSDAEASGNHTGGIMDADDVRNGGVTKTAEQPVKGPNTETGDPVGDKDSEDAHGKKQEVEGKRRKHGRKQRETANGHGPAVKKEANGDQQPGRRVEHNRRHECRRGGRGGRRSETVTREGRASRRDTAGVGNTRRGRGGARRGDTRRGGTATRGTTR